MSYTLHQLADLVNGEVSGDPDVKITAVATLNDAGIGDISFLTNSKYQSALQKTRASAVIIPPDCQAICKTNAIVVSNPHAAYAKIASELYPEVRNTSGVNASAVVESSARIADDVWIGANCYIGNDVDIGKGVQIHPGVVIGDNVRIGENSTLYPNVTIMHGCQLGMRCMIHSGVVIGSDGFGQANDQGRWLKVPQLGSVIVANDVEVGANTTIDRGSVGDTIIGDGVKLDNLIQVAHNVVIGAHTVVAAATAIAGSTKIGQHCVIAGAVGIVGHIEIADNVTILGMSMVSKSINKPGVYGGSIPATDSRKWAKQLANMRHLGDILKRLKILERD